MKIHFEYPFDLYDGNNKRKSLESIKKQCDAISRRFVLSLDYFLQNINFLFYFVCISKKVILLRQSLNLNKYLT